MMKFRDSIRQMRKAKGLKGFQLAERLQVSAARVSMLERDEEQGAVTLKMMHRAARALGCRFEYRLVPEQQQGALESHAKPRYRLV